MSINPLNITWDTIRANKAAIMEGYLGLELFNVITQYLRTGKLELDLIPEWLADAIQGPISESERILGEPLFELLVRSPSGISPEAWNSENLRDAKQTVQRMLGFATALPFAVSGIAEAAKMVLGDNWGEGIAKAIEKIPEDIGINWALGTVLANTFEQAVAGPITEAINLEHRPFRIEWPQVRGLLRQGHLSQAQAEERFRRIGVRDEDMPLLEQLDRSFLSLGDLQQMYLFGLMSESDVSSYLDVLGFSPFDSTRLIELYLKRAETAGGDQLRAVVQGGFIDGHLTEAQYRAYLDAVNIPQKSIELEVEAAKLTKGWAKAKFTVAQIKTLRSQGQIDDNTAVMDLIDLGYSDQDARSLLQSWKDEVKAGSTGLTENRILSYLIGGAIDKERAYSLLVDMGIRTDDARFLVEHPGSDGGLYSHPLSEATILAAYKDDVITQDEATALLRTINVAPEEITLRIQTANKAKAKGPKPKAVHKDLTDAIIIDALRYGLAEAAWCIRELVTLGYTESTAQLIIQIEETKLTGKVPTTWIKLN